MILPIPVDEDNVSAIKMNTYACVAHVRVLLELRRLSVFTVGEFQSPESGAVSCHLGREVSIHDVEPLVKTKINTFFSKK